MTLRSRPSSTGTTLAEALVACLLLFLLMGVLAMTVRRYREVSVLVGRQDSGLELALALQTVAREAGATVALSQPAPNATASSLVFQRVNPAAPGRLPTQRAPSPSPVPSSWNPVDPAWTVGIRFEVSNSVLIRETTFADGQQVRVRIAEPVDAFRAHLDQANLLTLTATQGTQEYVAAVYLP